VIEVILHGRLGNWLFQYAVGRRLALTHGTELRLNLFDRFKLYEGGVSWVARALRRLPLRADMTVVPPVIAMYGRRLGYAGGPTYYQEPRYGFNPEVLALPGDACLRGYFQSERYFRDIAPIIREELLLPISADADVSAVEDRIRDANAVAVHVRRTDYIAAGWDILNATYYAGAMQHLRQCVSDVRFFLFSDDVDWCRRHFSDTDCEVVDVPKARSDPFIDLRLMTLCRHYIIANSSYSWWGAWLNPSPGKVVVAPSVWFPRLDDNPLFAEDVLCPEWVRWPVT
jgi:Glycosyl transferase family 11